jgi:hypothetical protein
MVAFNKNVHYGQVRLLLTFTIDFFIGTYPFFGHFFSGPGFYGC